MGKLQPTLSTVKIFSVGYGALFALFVLSGRWGFGRMLGENIAESTSFFQLRYWTVLGTLTIFFLRVADRRRGRWGDRKLQYLIIGFLCYYLMSYLWAPSDNSADEKGLDLLLMLAATLAFMRARAILPEVLLMRSFWGIVLAVSSLVGAAALLSPALMEGDMRLAALGGGANVFVRIMGYLSIAAMYVVESFRLGVLALPLVGVAGMLAVLSGSRGGIAAFACTFGLQAVFAIKARRAWFLGIGALILGFAASTRTTELGALVQERFNARVTKLTLEERYSAGREQLYRDAYDLGLESPVFGNGIGSFAARGFGVYPHNIVLEAFCEGGVVGVALFIGTVGMALRSAVRRSDHQNVPWLLGLVLILVASQFSGDLYDSRAVFICASWFVLGADNERVPVAAF